MLSSRLKEEYLDFAVQSAYDAGRLTLGYFRTEMQPEMKGDDTPVTAADRNAEKLIRGRIEKRYPNHRIVGEEFESKGSDASTPCWWIDPIDGTKAFVRGVPLYGVLVGLEVENRIVVGAVYFPALEEMIYAADGCGCFLNGRRCRVSTTPCLARSIVSFTSAANFKTAGRNSVWGRAVDATYHSVGWSDAYGHALVAAGRLELMLDPLMNPYDCGPLPVILREAGGYFGDWSGNETIYANEGLSTTRELLPEVLQLIRESGERSVF
jgi:myo-inositol-1(or 4)-monophosphatase